MGGIIGTELPGRVPRKELFEAHAVARIVENYFPEHMDITEFCAGLKLEMALFVFASNQRKCRQILVCGRYSETLSGSLSLIPSATSSVASTEQKGLSVQIPTLACQDCCQCVGDTNPAGCGLLGIFLMLFNPRRHVRCSDKKQQLLARRLQDALSVRWPCLQGIKWEEAGLLGIEMCSVHISMKGEAPVLQLSELTVDKSLLFPAGGCETWTAEE